jgi:hypothetical protein
MNAGQEISKQFSTCVRYIEETLKVRPLSLREDHIFVGYATGLAFALDKLGVQHVELPEGCKAK